MSASRPDAAGIFATLARQPGRDPAERAADLVSAAALRAGRAMQNGRAWHTRSVINLTGLRPAPRRPRAAACCAERPAHGHRGEKSRFIPCPSRAAA